MKKQKILLFCIALAITIILFVIENLNTKYEMTPFSFFYCISPLILILPIVFYKGDDWLDIDGYILCLLAIFWIMVYAGNKKF